MRILIVDDQPSNRKLLRAELESESHSVVEAGDGVEALKLLEREVVEAVISDVLMPNMDGFRFCHEVRMHHRLASIPFIIYTNTYDSPSDRTLGQAVGADGYFVRPSPAKEILKKIAATLEVGQRVVAVKRHQNVDHIVKHYNAALVSKLEHKNQELGKANGELLCIRDQLQRLLEFSPVVIYSLKVEGGGFALNFVSENLRRMLGFEPVEVDYDWWVDHVHPQDRQRAVEHLRTVLKNGIKATQYRLRHRNGHYVYVEDTRRVVVDAAGIASEISGVWTDISERKQSEERLREQARLLDLASDAIIVRDLDGRIEFWNWGAQRVYGWTAEEAVGKHAGSFLEKDGLTTWQAQQALMRDGEWSGEIRKCTKSGGEVLVQARWTMLRSESGLPKAILTIATDITEKKKLEARFFRTQRLESIGTLASGIAHDLNNVLTPILMSLAVLKEMVAEKDGQSFLQSLEQNTHRASEIVKQVLAYARGVRGERVVIDPKHLLKEMAGVMRETFPKSIQLVTKCEEDVWPITGDPTQLHQVLLNLCINARDAMPQGGKLALTMNNVVFDEQYSELIPGGAKGNYVSFEVSDTGIGIPPELRERIFEPFFTTKEVGHGTGLGLSTVSAILKSHGGFVTISSELGKGSVFRVFLPASSAPAHDFPSQKSLHGPKGNGELILVVDDEELILNAAQRALLASGYQVITAKDGATGVAQYAQHRDSIALVLTDMMMPVMDGAAMIRVLQKINPGVQVIAATGYGSEAGINKALAVGVRHHLQKPFDIETLLKMLHELLSKPPANLLNSC